MLDANIVYDYLGKRYPHDSYAVTLLSLGLQGKGTISLKVYKGLFDGMPSQTGKTELF